MKFIIIAIIVSLAFAEPQKRRYLKGASQTCYSGEYLVENKGNPYCVKCSDMCAEECVKNDGCKKCKPASFQDGYGGCDPCMLGCDECENAEVCKKCNATAYMMEGNCYLNPVMCAKAEDGKGCVECKENYFLTNTTNGNCTACSADGKGCAAGQCNSKTTAGCQKVVEEGDAATGGYYISGGTAWNCDKHCALCYEKSRDQKVYDGIEIPPGSPNGCLKCETGYFWFESAAGDMRYCKKCDVQCATCSGMEYNCETCNEGYEKYYAYQNSNGTYVNSCRMKQDSTICTKRAENEREDLQYCTECAAGYYLDGSSYCVPIHPKHKDDCGDDFSKINGTCKPITENCETVGENNLCTKCAPMTYLKDGYCLKCHENCIDCDQDGNCLHCKPGYYSNGTYTCYPDLTSTVEGANEKIWEIGNNTHPHRCVEDKYVDFSNVTRTCKSCSQYCLEENIPQGEGENATVIKINYCDTAVGCLRCKEGFYVSPNGECSSCSPHCAFCDQTLGCLHCLGETVMVDGRCEYSGATSVLTLLILLILAFAI